MFDKEHQIFDNFVDLIEKKKIKNKETLRKEERKRKKEKEYLLIQKHHKVLLNYLREHHNSFVYSHKFLQLLQRLFPNLYFLKN